MIQTIGRVARHFNGRAILYADKMTGSMQRAIQETERRREKQQQYNEANNITPTSVVRAVKNIMEGAYSEKSVRGKLFPRAKVADNERDYSTLSAAALAAEITKLEIKCSSTRIILSLKKRRDCATRFTNYVSDSLAR